MNLPLPARAIVVWFFLLIGLLSLSLLGMTSYDYYQYKSSYGKLQANELDEVRSITDKAQESAMQLGSLIADRIAVSGANKAKIQSILSSVSYLASLDGLPAVQSVQYISAEDPSMQITRFGVQPNNEIIDFGRTDSTSLNSQTFTLYKAVQAAQETQGVLLIQFDIGLFKEKLGSFKTLALRKEADPNKLGNEKEGLFYTLMPQGFPEFVMTELNHYISLGIVIFATLISVLFLYFILRQQFERSYSGQIVRLKKDLQELIDSEYKNQTYRDGQSAFKRIRILLVQRQKQQIQHIQTSLKHLQQAVNDPNLYLDESEQGFLLSSCESSLETVLDGGCAPLSSEECSVSEVISLLEELFAERIHSNEISIINELEQEFCVNSDRIFLTFVLANLLGRGIYRCQSLGEVRITNRDNEAGKTLDILDSGVVTSQSLEDMIAESHELFIDADSLKQMCESVGIAITYKRVQGGNLVSIFLPDGSAQEVLDNVVPLFS